MKILHAITCLSVGGAENMLTKLIEAGDNDSFQPSVLSMMAPDTIANRIRAKNVEVHSLGMRQGLPTPLSLHRLARIARSVRPDVVLGWMHHGNLAATMASWMLPSRPPVIWNIRHSLIDLSYEKPMTRAVLRLGAKLSHTPAAIIFNSQVAARQYEAFGFPADRTVLIPNGFDCDQYHPRPDARARLCQSFGIDGKVTIVGMIARLHPMKDPENLVEAVRRARQAGHDLHLMIIGHGSDDPHSGLAKAIADTLPANRVTTTGQRQDIADWLPGFDIFALPSAWGEGFPNVIGEAMACGVPCVATDVGDSGWIIGGNGRVVPPRDPEALAQALIWLDQLGPEARRTIGAGARVRVIETFSLPAIVSQYEELFETVHAGLPLPKAADATTAEHAKAVLCAG